MKRRKILWPWAAKVSIVRSHSSDWVLCAVNWQKDLPFSSEHETLISWSLSGTANHPGPILSYFWAVTTTCHVQIESKNSKTLYLGPDLPKEKMCICTADSGSELLRGYWCFTATLRILGSVGKDTRGHRAAAVWGIFCFLELNPWLPLPVPIHRSFVSEHTNLLPLSKSQVIGINSHSWDSAGLSVCVRVEAC